MNRLSLLDALLHRAPRSLSPGRAEEAVAQATRIGTLVEPTETIRVVQEDPADDRVLEAALEGGPTSSSQATATCSAWDRGAGDQDSAFLEDLE